MRKRFTDEQITQILAEYRGGMKVMDLCRKHGVSSPTLYKWLDKFGGMDAQNVRKLKDFEQRIGRMERIIAQKELEIHALKDLLDHSKNF